MTYLLLSSPILFNVVGTLSIMLQPPTKGSIQFLIFSSLFKIISIICVAILFLLPWYFIYLFNRSLWMRAGVLF